MADADWASAQVVMHESDPSAETLSTLPDWVEALRAEPAAFGLFTALRRFESDIWRADPDARRTRRLGESDRLVEDPVRLRQVPSLSFAASTIADFDTSGAKPSLGVYLFGMFGPQGALPLHLTEHALDRIAWHRDATFRDFIDIFHHRLLSLYFRAWASGQPAVHFDRPETDRYAAYFGSLFGLGSPALRDRVEALPDRAMLHFAGHYSDPVCSRERLAAILADFFGVPAAVEPFVGRWLDLPESAYCRLGESMATGALGQTAIAGSSVWDVQHNFRVVVGPMEFTQFARLLPDANVRTGLSPRLERMHALVASYVGESMCWDLELRLAPPAPPAILGQQGWLGWSAFTAGDCGDGCSVRLDVQGAVWELRRAARRKFAVTAEAGGSKAGN